MQIVKWLFGLREGETIISLYTLYISILFLLNMYGFHN